MDLSIIIVSWNTQDLLAKCLSSIFNFTRSLDFEVFVVDNASTDNTPAMLQRDFPQVHLIANKDNLGFAQANNQAINQAQGNYILLLNPDTEVFDSSLSHLLDFMASHPEIDILGPKLLHSDKTTQASLRRFPKFWDQFLILLKLHNFFPNLSPLKKYHMFDFSYDEPAPVDQIMGAAMLIRKELFDKIGLLDEKFWLLFEEVDFCRRAKNAGAKIYFTPQAQIIHHKGESFSQRQALSKQINFNRNLFRYFRKHKPYYQLVFLWLLEPLSLLLALIDQLFNLKGKVGKNRDL